MTSKKLDVPLIDEEYHSILTPKILHAIKYLTGNNNIAKTDHAKFAAQCITSFLMYYYSSPSRYNILNKNYEFQSPGMKTYGMYITGNYNRFWLWIVYSIVLPRIIQRCTNALRRNLRLEHDEVQQQMIMMIHNNENSCEYDENQEIIISDVHRSTSSCRNISRRIRLARIRRYKMKRVILSLVTMTPAFYWIAYTLIDDSKTESGIRLPPTLSMYFSGMTIMEHSNHVHAINYSYTHKRILYGQLLRTAISALSCLFFIPTNNDLDIATTADILQPDGLQNELVNLISKAWAQLKEWSPSWNISTNGCCNICHISREFIKCPYEIQPCGHVACYMCLRVEALEYCEEKFKCHTCGCDVISSSPFRS